MEGGIIGGLVRGGFEEGCEDKKRKLMLTSSDVISQEETNTIHSVSPKHCSALPSWPFPAVCNPQPGLNFTLRPIEGGQPPNPLCQLPWSP